MRGIFQVLFNREGTWIHSGSIIEWLEDAIEILDSHPCEANESRKIIIQALLEDFTKTVAKGAI